MSLPNDTLAGGVQNRGEPTLDSAGKGGGGLGGWFGVVDGWLTAGERIIEGARGGFDVIVQGAPAQESTPPAGTASAKVAAQSTPKPATATAGTAPITLSSVVAKAPWLPGAGMVAVILGALWFLTRK